MREIFLPASLLAGAVIGAGMFSLPYAVSRGGSASGLLTLGLLAIAMTLVHLLYAEVVMRTPGTHNFVGYAWQYLGVPAGTLSVILAVVHTLVILVIYLILARSFTALLGIFPQQSLIPVLLFWAVGSLAIFLDLAHMAVVQLVANLGMAFIIGTIFVLGLVAGQHSVALALPSVAFLPLGPLLFSLAGRVAVAEVVRSMGPRPSLAGVRWAVIIGTVAPALLYGLFIVGVLFLSGSAVTPDAVSGLLGRLPQSFLWLVGCLGLLAIWTSYVAVGFNVKDIFRLDLGVSRRDAAALLVFSPLFLYWFGFTDFIFLVSLAGGVFLALESLLVIWMWWRLRSVQTGKGRWLLAVKHSWFVALGLAFIFVAALLNEVWRLFGGG